MKKQKINLDLFAGMLIAFGLGILILAFIDRSQGVLTHSEFGEYTGGGVATLFTLAGILLFIQALKVQREELRAVILSRDVANAQSERQSKIQLITGRIQANAAVIEAKKIDKPTKTEIIREFVKNISELASELANLLDEMKEEEAKKGE